MTRFARAKGSKASNEKLPEEATSWREMKQEFLERNKELAEKKNREEALQKRQDNYKAFLHDLEEEESRNVSWAEFPTPETDNPGKVSKKRKLTTNNNNNDHVGTKKLKRQNLPELEGSDYSGDEEFSALVSQSGQGALKKHENASDSDSVPPEEVGIKEKPKEIVVKKSKPKASKHKLKIVVDKNNQTPALHESNAQEEEKIFQASKNTLKNTKVLTEKEQKLISKKHDRRIKQVEKKKLKKQKQQKEKSAPNQVNGLADSKTEKKLERRKRQKEKKKSNLATNANGPTDVKDEDTLTEKDIKNIEKKKMKRARQVEKKKKSKELKALAQQSSNSDNQIQDEKINPPSTVSNELHPKSAKINNKVNNGDKISNKQSKNQVLATKKPNENVSNGNHKQAKPRDNKDHASRKQKSETIFLNGKTVEIDYVDGFPVMKDDAERLNKLKKEMISKGLPRSEINIALKLERRRAEKAFARARKSVCFKCRKSGHEISDCPELESDQIGNTTGTGICFKCGSTEHTHYECKTVRGMDYKFASCFICNEQGHIAKQCPDNQRGLYPKGGACKVCGDVTHLKKDCPKYQAQQAQLQNSMSVGTLNYGNPDEMDGKGSVNLCNGVPKKMNKVIKF